MAKCPACNRNASWVRRIPVPSQIGKQTILTCWYHAGKTPNNEKIMEMING